ncbi:MAG: ketoacyl-ACP synthase III, partial [Candidatus Heimdallarchaeota archaeon]|nr:ketoacyl-ACP synthase III [Candidatus Heimdallarchaeota archaeon]
MTELKRVGIQGLGYYLPERVIENSYFIDVLGLDTTDEWIQKRSGIKQRRWAREDEYTSDLSTSAALNAMKNAGVSPEEIDFMLIGNCTPDYQFPTTSNIVHKNLGLRPNCGVIDTPSACSSFVYALTLAAPLIKCGEAKKVLVIGAEKLSSITNPKDRGTCVLLADAAGALVLTEHTEDLPEVLAHTYGCQLNIDALYRPMSGLREMPTHEGIDNDRQFMIMKGREIYSFAVRKFYEETLNVVKKAGLT